MSKFVPLKDFKYEVGKLSLMVEHYVSSDLKNSVAFSICGKNIWENNYPNYFRAEQKFLIIKKIIRDLKIKFADLKSEDVNSEKIKEISKELLLEFKKMK
jgi:hypothetical protein